MGSSENVLISGMRALSVIYQPLPQCCLFPGACTPPKLQTPTPTSPVLSWPKLSWAAQRSRLCVTPCQALLEAVRWQPPSLSVSPCPLQGWGSAIALHTRAPQCCDRKAWLAVTWPCCRGMEEQRRESEEEGGDPGGVRAAPQGVILSIQQELKSWWGNLCVCVC